MNTNDTSSLAQGLLRAARSDRPTEATRSRIWEQVSLAPHLVVVSPLAAEAVRNSIAPAAKAATVGFSAGKLLLAGVLVGSAMTAGLGAFFMRSPTRDVVTVDRVATPQAEVISGVKASPATREAPALAAPIDDGLTVVAASPEPATQQTHPSVREAPRSRAVAPREPSADDHLMQEAALVGRARRAIVQGNAADALDVLDVAAREPRPSLEPEELSLRVRALRMLGRDAEATRVLETLKSRYPGSLLVGN
jgi:hypothetical protein